MTIGSALVGKLGAVITYVKARVDIKLDWDSKNTNPTDSVTASDDIQIDFTIGKFFTDTVSLVSAVAHTLTKPFTDSVSTSDAVALTIGVNIAESVTVSDAITTQYDGMILGGGPILSRMLLGGNTSVAGTDILIIIS